MRDLAKSFISFSWALPLFGIKQAANLANPKEWQDPSTTVTAMNAVTDAAEAQLGEALKGAFQAGDRLQRQSIDLAFKLVPGDLLNPSRWMDLMPGLGDCSKDSTAAGGADSNQAGWGPMPSVGD